MACAEVGSAVQAVQMCPSGLQVFALIFPSQTSGGSILVSWLHTNTGKRREGDHPLIINGASSRLTTYPQRVVLKFHMHQDHLSNFIKMQNSELPLTKKFIFNIYLWYIPEIYFQHRLL